MYLELSDHLLILSAYFLGSVPFGVVVADLAGIGDLRTQGSGNIGATNVTRIGGKKLGAITLVLDALKGVIPVIIAQQMYPPATALAAGVAAVFGHIFPVWYKFRGGKGVATTLAVITALQWPIGIIVCGIWLSVFKLFRISSLAALVAMAIAPALSYYIVGQQFGLTVLILSTLVIARHHENIIRLMKGQEGKLKSGK